MASFLALPQAIICNALLAGIYTSSLPVKILYKFLLEVAIANSNKSCGIQRAGNEVGNYKADCVHVAQLCI